MGMQYPSNLTETEFAEILPYLPVKKITRPRKWSYHEIINGILYVLVSGCQWRMLPKDLPPWETVHYYFSTWHKLGIIDLVLKKSGKKISSNAGKRTISDSGYRR
jgi:putative transposase